MNVLLVFPFSIIAWNNKYEEPRIPLNITYLASVARQAGHNVTLVDLRVEQQKCKLDPRDSLQCDDAVMLTEIMQHRISEGGIDVVGINCLYSGLFPVVLHLAKQIKSQNHNIKVVTGGIHPTIYAREILRQYGNYIDYVIIGEGESSFVELLNALRANDAGLISRIDGVGYLDDDHVFINPKRKFIEQLDKLPFPAVDLLNVPDYFTDTSAWHSPKGLPIKTPVPILTSRSCPNMCTFCSMHLVHGNRIRYRSAGNVVEEIKTYLERYGLSYFNITDDNLNIHRQRVIELMDLIVKENLNIQFSTENGIFIRTLDEEVLDALNRAGLARLHLAFESGSDFIRTKIIGKRISNKTIEDLKHILAKPKYNHIYLYGYFVIGFPEETDKSLEQTYELITSFPLDNYSVFYATPFPGTPLYEQCMKGRLFTEEYFYDTDLLVNQVDVGQMVKGLPCIKPYNLKLADLIEFKAKALDYLQAKRASSGVPMSSPLRFGKQ